MSFVVPQQAQQIDCLQRVLRYDPTHRQAQARLVEVMTGQAAEPPQTTLSPSTFMSAADSAQRTEDIQRDEDAWQAEAARIEQVAHPERVVPEDKRAAPAPIEPAPEPGPAEFANLRSKLAVPVKEYRKPRRSYKALLTVLIIVVLIAAGGTAFVMLRNRQAEEAAAALNASATPTAYTDRYSYRDADALHHTHAFSADLDGHAAGHTAPNAHAYPAADRQRYPGCRSTRGAASRCNAAQSACRRTFGGIQRAARSSEQRRDEQPRQRESVQRPARSRPTAERAGDDRPGLCFGTYITNQQIDPTGGYYDPRAREVFVIGDRPLGVQHQAFALEAARACDRSELSASIRRAYIPPANSTRSTVRPSAPLSPAMRRWPLSNGCGSRPRPKIEVKRKLYHLPDSDPAG